MAQTAQIVFAVDESGSMAGEQTFLQTFVPNFTTQLTAAGVAGVEYGLVGYGSSGVSARQFLVGGTPFGNAADFATAAGLLETSGGTEDGYEAIDFILTNYAFNADPANVRVIVLVTDEDRDVTTPATAASIQAGLTAQGIVLAGILDQGIEDPNGVSAIGASAVQTYLDANADGVFERSGPPVFTFADGSTQADYTDIIIGQDRGCVADLNRLRNGGTDADAFASALADCLIQIVVGPVGTDPFIIYGTRDAMIAHGQSFANQMSYRLSGRAGGSDAGDGGGQTFALELGGITHITNETYAADLPQGVTPIALGALKGFLSIQGSFASSSYDPPFTNYDRGTFAGAVGLDYEFRPGFLAGVALGYASSSVDSDAGDSVDADALSLGVYGSAKVGQNGFVDGTLSYTWGDISTARLTGGGVATGETDSGAFAATVTGGVKVARNAWVFVPAVEVGYINVSTDSFTETGPGAVTWAEQNDHIYWLNPRVTAHYDIPTSGGKFTPYAGVGVRFQGGDSNPVAGIVGGGGAVATLPIPDVGDTAFEAQLGAAFTNSAGNMSARVDYQGFFGGNGQQHNATFRLRVAF